MWGNGSGKKTADEKGIEKEEQARDGYPKNKGQKREKSEG